MAKYNLTTIDELNDEVWGPIGTPERDAMEARLKEDLNAYFLGEAIKKARIERKLTQAELGDLIGVKKSQISKLEKGRSVITLPTISKVFKALGATTAFLDLGKMGKIALW